MYDSPPIAVNPSKESANVPLQVKGLNVRILDDGTFILRCEKEGRKKDGMMVHDSKEYSYDTPEALTSAIKNDFLKRGLSDSRKKKEKNGLAER